MAELLCLAFAERILVNPQLTLAIRTSETVPLLCEAPSSHSMNLTQCFVNLSNTCNATAPGTILGLVNSAGGLIQCPQDIAQAAGMSYTTCKEQCGRGPESFAWGTFAQQFSAWLLPWLALVSQLPFGAASKHQLDNF